MKKKKVCANINLFALIIEVGAFVNEVEVIQGILFLTKGKPIIILLAHVLGPKDFEVALDKTIKGSGEKDHI